MCQTKCVIEVPPTICTQLNVTLTASLLEVPSYSPSNIINVNQSYVVRVCAELGSDIQRILCGWWCFSVAVESCGPSPDLKWTKQIKMDNCTPGPDCVDFTINGSDFGVKPEECGNVFNFCVTMVALDNCDKKPIGIAGFCTLGPVMVYS